MNLSLTYKGVTITINDLPSPNSELSIQTIDSVIASLAKHFDLDKPTRNLAVCGAGVRTTAVDTARLSELQAKVNRTSTNKQDGSTTHV
jgi:hypothetical protein